jgi:hypothetical protein
MEDRMTAQETVALYYDAWRNKHGDFSEVPLADDFQFSGPVASFDSADGYRAMARDAGQAVRSFEVRRQFVDENLVCSIIDWEMAGDPRDRPDDLSRAAGGERRGDRGR